MRDVLQLLPPDPTPPAWVVPLLDRIDRLLAALERAGPPVETADQWMSAAELADYLHVCERSIRTWERLGKLPPPVRVGRLKKWNKAALLRYLSKTAR